MFSYFKNKMKKEEELTKKKFELIVEDKNKELEQLRKKILSLKCPFTKGYCSVECVHYYKGTVDIYRNLYVYNAEYNIAELTPPKCRLWKD